MIGQIFMCDLLCSFCPVHCYVKYTIIQMLILLILRRFVHFVSSTCGSGWFDMHRCLNQWIA